MASRNYVALVNGASRGIGASVAKQLLARTPFSVIATCRDVEQAHRNIASRDNHRLTVVQCDLTNEKDIEALASGIKTKHGNGGIRLVFNSAGYLKPEKSLKQISVGSLLAHFYVNAFAPLLVAKHVAPLYAPAHDTPTPPPTPTWSRNIFASISARTGSIGDNRTGGWYSYRASKAALNQIHRSLSIELSRTKGVICTVLHPGTCDTDLSRPYVTKTPPNGVLYSPDQAAENLVNILESLTVE
ncbi:hypothetical protein SeMB42_g07675 [Synchytrium endobioticum]|uniref:Uncharacterized protein n=1 Tax=Synchytrium endobioticum TaxID=286115 RepID=A0A507BYL6_9FUNG|nr:hypothetical protein SeMB42_g07675 [Synchytrium endobioticum]TPX42258.1 hypothetical protein SeLEV6574_g05694 [Synchytrium endobioticum]